MINFGNPETTVISFAPPIVGHAPFPPPLGPDIGIFFGNPLVAEISFASPAVGHAMALHGSTYRLLEPHWQGTHYYDAGSIITTTSNDGMTDFPSTWVPTLAVDPLNALAVNAFYAAGPRALAYEDLNSWARIQFSPIAPPVTHWVQNGNLFSLTGLGVSLPPVRG